MSIIANVEFSSMGNNVAKIILNAHVSFFKIRYTWDNLEATISKQVTYTSVIRCSHILLSVFFVGSDYKIVRIVYRSCIAILIDVFVLYGSHILS